ncbi:acyl-CoA dehydrogenase family protein [Novosphingobium gossypii]|uniref:acyl-CoA dehydrogenase family protein n=1 Tax=Novosphingobium gossypii TaxID=1604774 RepID=UPI003D22DAE7
MSVVELRKPEVRNAPSIEPPVWEDLAARFRPIFARIAEGAVTREIERRLPHEEVNWLREAGFGAVRIPITEGGSGATIAQLFRLLVELGEADSNLVQILRAHFAFVEIRLNDDEQPEVRRTWFERIVAGALVGAAMAERTSATETTLELVREDDHYRLNGRKYYCTGTLYADWVSAAARDGEARVSVLVPTDAEGVTRIDDWDGFGQRLTGSGSTVFDNVRVEEAQILRRFNPGEFRADSYITAFYQQFHLSALTGIARAVKRDAIAFVQAKTRTFGVPGNSDPRNDPLVQRVVGKIASHVFAAEAIVDSVSAALDAAYASYLAGAPDDDLFLEADRRAYQGQQVLVHSVPEIAALLFEVGGSSATQESRRLDRHWRNARTLGSHNPAILREKVLGDHFLNGTDFRKQWAEQWNPAKPEDSDAEATPETTAVGAA